MGVKTYKTTVFADDFVFLEGPRWKNERLWVSDMRGHKVYALDENGAREVVAEVPNRPSGLGFMPDGTLLVVSMTNRLVYRQVDGALVLHADLSALVEADINDMVVDDQGRAYIGNIGFDVFGGAPPDKAEITLVEPDGSARHVAQGLDCPNGMVIKNDGRTLVAAESFGHRVTEFDRAEDGGLSNPRTLVSLPDMVPDGICLDTEGSVWVSCAMGSKFILVDGGGAVIAGVDVTPRSAIACQLGGAEGRTLFCLTYDGGIEDIGKGLPGARIEVAEVDVPGAGSP